MNKLRLMPPGRHGGGKEEWAYFRGGKKKKQQQMAVEVTDIGRRKNPSNLSRNMFSRKGQARRDMDRTEELQVSTQACGWAVVDLDVVETQEPCYGMYGTILVQHEARRAIEKREILIDYPRVVRALRKGVYGRIATMQIGGSQHGNKREPAETVRRKLE